MAARVIYSPITPPRKLDAAERARTVWAPGLQTGGMGVNRVAVAVLGDRICRDHSRVDR